MKKTQGLIGFAIIVTTLTSLVGCNGTKNLEQSMIINTDVKSEAQETLLKIIDKKEYEVEQNQYVAQEMYTNIKGELNITSRTIDHLTDNDETKLGYAIEKLIFTGDIAKKEVVKKGEIYTNNVVFSDNGTYNYELMSNDSILRLFNPMNNDEIILNYSSLKSAGFFKENQGHTYTLLENTLLEYVYSNNKVGITQINWINIDNYNSGTIKIPDEINLLYVDKIINNKLYCATRVSAEPSDTTSSSSNPYNANTVTLIDLYTNEVYTPIEVENDDLQVDIITLNENKVLLAMAEPLEGILTERYLKLKVLDVNNKTIKDISTIKGSNYMYWFSPNGDMVIYEQVNDGKKQLIASKIKDNELQGKCVIYEYGLYEQSPAIVFGDSSKEIMLCVTKSDQVQDPNDSSTEYVYDTLISVIKISFNM